MRTFTRNLLAAAAVVSLTATLLTPAASQAQTNVYTDPVGFVSIPIVGNGYTYTSLPLTQIVVQRGIIGVANSTFLTDNSGSWTNGQFQSANGGIGYFIEITSGPYAGLMDDIVATTGPKVIQTADDLTDTVGSTNIVGQTYKIYPHWTLNSAFGPPSQSGLQPGNNQSSADNIAVFNPVTQQNATYWYRQNNSGSNLGWRATSSLIDVGTNVLYIEQGIVILRINPNSTTNILVGAAKLGTTISPVAGNGYTFCGDVYAAGYTLSNSLLYSGSSSTGINGGTSQSASDNVVIWDPKNQVSDIYWYRYSNAGAPLGWRGTSSLIDVGTNSLPIGSILLVQRKISTPFNWSMPAPY